MSGESEVGRLAGPPASGTVNTTLAYQVGESRLPAAVNPAFRRMTRPRGALMRKAVPQSSSRTSDVISRLNADGITAAPPKQTPEKVVSVEAAASSLLPFNIPDWLRKLLLSEGLRGPLVLAALGLMVAVMGLTARGAGLAALGVIVYLRSRSRAALRVSRENRTAAAIQSVPPRPGFVLTEPGATLPADIGRRGAADSLDAARFRQALVELHTRYETPVPVKTIGPPLDFDRAVVRLERTLNPVISIPRRARSVVAIPPTFEYLRPTETIVPVMAHPVISDPMYRPLRRPIRASCSSRT